MSRGTTFKDLRQAVELATDRLLDVIHGEADENDEVAMEGILKIARVGVLSLVQIAQELNEIKHLLTEYTAERE